MGASKLKIKVVAKGKHARDLAQTLAGMPDSSGANFVSRNDLHLDSGVSSGVNHASRQVPYRARPGIAGKSDATPELKGTATAQANVPETGSHDGPAMGAGPGPSYVGEGIDTVKPITREINPIEKARMANNKTRDARTNLGRGKAGVPSVEEENNVTVTR
jgi:hypothetical protein